MRIASFNVENLFDRAKAFGTGAEDGDRAALTGFSALFNLLAQPVYSDADKAEMVRLMTVLGLDRSDDAPLVLLRRNRGKLMRRPREGGVEIVAGGRADWVGSLELKVAPVNEAAVRNTARVIRDVGADIIALVEVESRPVLRDFNAALLPAVEAAPYDHVMVIDGNDSRGIDVGLMSRAPWPIESIRSHVDDADADGLIFSRDCAEYRFTMPGGGPLLMMVNHFKSKLGMPAQSDLRRRAQAARVRAIYEERRGQGIDFIAIVGDFNDSPDRPPLQPLLGEGSDLRDISTHPDFDHGGFPGTFGSSGARDKIDYILLSPALFAKARRGGIFRKGMWPGVRPRKWDTFPELTREVEAASDHGAIWAVKGTAN
jgi:endonuclease/exonuclease/phosphatase family metal-dependent hydrolase